MFKLYEECGGILDSTDNLLQTPLHIAVLYNRKKLIENLAFTYNHQRDKNGFTVLEYASLFGKLEILKSLSNYVSWDSLNETSRSKILNCACASSDTKIIDFFIKEINFNLNSVDSSSLRNILHQAVHFSKFDISYLLKDLSVQQIIDDGDRSKRTPLILHLYKIIQKHVNYYYKIMQMH